MTLWSQPLRCLLAFTALSAAVAHADDLLRAEIDRVIAADSSGPVSPPTSDYEFLRRVSISFVGMPPTVEQLQAFVNDPAPNKRELAVDRLISSPQFARQMAMTFDVMLMERRANANIPQDDWHAYLLKSFRENKPYNVLAKEILSADGSQPGMRAAARFFLDRNGGEPNLVTRDVGRIFFGRDFQCNQCHDHPLIADYLQTDYHGLYAFFGASGSQVIKEGDKQVPYYAERSPTDATFESVFIKGIRHTTRPKLPGEAELTEPAFYPGDEYEVRPAENVKPVPKYSRRAKLAELATGGANRAFNENIVNRLWGYMLGRGLVSPPDLHHSSNPPTHPALLKLLGERFVAMNFDVRAFLKEIALSQVYQRSIDGAGDLNPSAEQLLPALPQLTAARDALDAEAKQLRAKMDESIKDWAGAEAALLPALAEWDAARAKSQEIVKKLDDARKAVHDATAQVAAKTTIATAVTEAATKATEATKLLPKDQELAAATAKFNERVASLNKELEGLKKAVEDKTNAAKGVETELAGTRPAIDAAQAKMDPLSEACRQKYEVVATIRRTLADEETRVAADDERLRTLNELQAIKTQQAELAAAEQNAAQLVAVSQTVAARQTEITGAIQTAEAAHQQAVRDAAAADAAVAAAQQEQARRTDNVNAVNAAVTSSDAALVKLPNDAALTEATQKLKSRAAELATAVTEQQAAIDAAASNQKAVTEKLVVARSAFEEIIAERGRRQEAARAAQQAAEQAAAQVATLRTAIATTSTDLQTRWMTDASVASLQPLSPEQLCESVFRATGIYENYRAAEVAELDKSAPLSDADKADPAKVLSREIELETRVYDKLLKPNIPAFVNLYGVGAGQPQGDFFASAEQALYTANGGSILSWAGPNGNNITTQIINEADAKKVAEKLYLSILSRLPSEAESKDVETYLAARPDQKPAAAQELVWGLVASVEFRMNH